MTVERSLPHRIASGHHPRVVLQVTKAVGLLFELIFVECSSSAGKTDQRQYAVHRNRFVMRNIKIMRHKLYYGSKLSYSGVCCCFLLYSLTCRITSSSCRIPAEANEESDVELGRSSKSDAILYLSARATPALNQKPVYPNRCDARCWKSSPAPECHVRVASTNRCYKNRKLKRQGTSQLLATAIIIDIHALPWIPFDKP